MLIWFFTSIWHALVGFVLLSGLLVAAIYVLGRAIAEGAAHDQARCDCVDCRRRRNDAVRKRWSGRNAAPDDEVTDIWISTIKLMERGPGTRVSVKGVTYEFNSAEPHEGSWTLRLTKIADRRRAIVTMGYESGHRRCWKLEGGRIP